MGMSDLVTADRAVGAGPSDHDLVRAVRRGDDRAFEELYARYQRRITAYVGGMVKDHGRAEDITQEVFVSAFRRMRATERPIAFKPWVYEIAKNACIDAYRRGRRAEEVSFDADDRLTPSDYGRLIATDPAPDAAVDAKQDLDHLCGAFGGLSDTHHQILVMRELEGLSYKDIGEQLGMSRPAVESTLFRARKRLSEEYDELASGARCLRIQGIIAGAGEARLGLRDQRRLARHVSHCQPCRRLTAEAGLDVPVPVRTRVAQRIAGLLPLPAFLRLRRGGDDAVAATGGGSSGAPGWTAHLPALAEPLQTGWGKATAGVAALLLAGAGAGVGTTVGDGKRDERGTGAQPAAAAAHTQDGAAAGTASARRPVSTASRSGAGKAQVKGSVKPRGGGGERATERSLGAGAQGAGGGSPQRDAQRGDDGGSPGATLPERGGGGGGGGGGRDRGDGGGSRSPSPPKVDPGATPTIPAAGGAQETLQNTVNNVDQTVRDAGSNVNQTVQNAGQNVQKVLTEPQNLLPNVQQTANDALTDVDKTVNDAVGGLGQTVGGLLRP
jgi:RNA polymerase sigma factor (sigma-70 family)